MTNRGLRDRPRKRFPGLGFGRNSGTKPVPKVRISTKLGAKRIPFQVGSDFICPGATAYQSIHTLTDCRSKLVQVSRHHGGQTALSSCSGNGTTLTPWDSCGSDRLQDGLLAGAAQELGPLEFRLSLCPCVGSCARRALTNMSSVSSTHFLPPEPPFPLPPTDSSIRRVTFEFLFFFLRLGDGRRRPLDVLRRLPIPHSISRLRSWVHRCVHRSCAYS